MARTIAAVVVGVLATGAAWMGSAGAAAGPQSWQPPAGGQRRGLGSDIVTVAQIERELNRFEIVEAQRALDLGDEEFHVVRERLERIQMLRRRQQNQRRQILMDLRAALEADTIDANVAAVNGRLAELGNLGVRHAQELRRAGLALDAVLTLRQRVEFRLFQERFERRKLDLLARARQGGGVPRPPPR